MLQTSAEAHGLYPQIMGYGKDAWWPTGLGVKINELRKFVRRPEVQSQDVVVYADAFDVIVFADRDEILAGFADAERLLNASIIFNAERYCYPPLEGLCDDYPPSPTRWRYLNSGLIAGRAWALRQLLQDPVPDVIEGSDQAWYQRQFRRGNSSGIIALDRECRLLCAVADADPDAVVLGAGARMVRQDTGYRPALAHFSGVGHWVRWPEGQTFATSYLADTFRKVYPDVARRFVDDWSMALQIGSTHNIRLYEGAGFWSAMVLVLCAECNLLRTGQRECEYFQGLLCERCRSWTLLGLLLALVPPLCCLGALRLAGRGRPLPPISCLPIRMPTKDPRFEA